MKHRPVLQPERVTHETRRADGDELAWSLTLATDGSHEPTVRVEHRDGRLPAPPHVDPARRVHHQAGGPSEGEPLGDIESVAQPEDLARLQRFGIGDQL